MIDLMTAIQSLRPNAELVVRGDVIEWMDNTQTQPTDAEIATETVRLQAEYDSKQYARDRLAEYPPIGDQLDALWKGGDEATAMKVIIDKVKSDNPKG